MKLAAKDTVRFLTDYIRFFIWGRDKIRGAIRAASLLVFLALAYYLKQPVKVVAEFQNNQLFDQNIGIGDVILIGALVLWGIVALLVVSLRFRASPRLQIKDEVDAGTWNHHYRITVENVSGSIVKHARVRLVASEPSMDHLGMTSIAWVKTG